MKQQTLSLINELKEQQEDFEWYPTKQEMVDCIAETFSENARGVWLDIGAGNGGFYQKVIQKRKELICDYAIIEKSDILRRELDKTLKENRKSYIFYGADFHECSLFDKKVDYIFCNPPYSEFAEWTCKIIEQAYCKKAFLIIPQRWADNDKIQHFIKQRGCTYKILGSFDFLNAERQARAKIDVIEFDFTVEYKNRWRESERTTPDPFDDYLKKQFKFTEPQIPQEDFKREEVLQNEIEIAGNPIEAYVNAYQKELMSMQKTYYTLGGLYQENTNIFKELKIDIDIITATLREKIKALRISYWQLFINKFDKIKERLTYNSRKLLFSSLRENEKLDFSVSNCYAIVIYAIENANKYFDRQIIDIFEKLSNNESIRNYKSNQKVYSQDDWRYKQEKPTHYTLDKRIVFSGYCSQLDKNYVNDDRILGDLITIAQNLGFKFRWSDETIYLGADKSKNEVYLNPSGKDGKLHDKDLFLEYRCFKNGNIHLRLNQEFMKAFNIEVARLKGWIHNKEDIINEFDEELEIIKEDCDKYYKSSYKIEIMPSQFLIEANLILTF
jgi:hypothetical protein